MIAAESSGERSPGREGEDADAAAEMAVTKFHARPSVRSSSTGDSARRPGVSCKGMNTEPCGSRRRRMPSVVDGRMCAMVHGAASRASARREQRGHRTRRTMGTRWLNPGPWELPLGCCAAPKKGLPQHLNRDNMMTQERLGMQSLEPKMPGREWVGKEGMREKR